MFMICIKLRGLKFKYYYCIVLYKCEMNSNIVPASYLKSYALKVRVLLSFLNHNF